MSEYLTQCGAVDSDRMVLNSMPVDDDYPHVAAVLIKSPKGYATAMNLTYPMCPTNLPVKIYDGPYLTSPLLLSIGPNDQLLSSYAVESTGPHLYIVYPRCNATHQSIEANFRPII